MTWEIFVMTMTNEEFRTAVSQRRACPEGPGLFDRLIKTGRVKLHACMECIQRW